MYTVYIAINDREPDMLGQYTDYDKAVYRMTQRTTVLKANGYKVMVERQAFSVWRYDGMIAIVWID